MQRTCQTDLHRCLTHQSMFSLSITLPYNPEISMTFSHRSVICFVGWLYWFGWLIVLGWLYWFGWLVWLRVSILALMDRSCCRTWSKTFWASTTMLPSSWWAEIIHCLLVTPPFCAFSLAPCNHDISWFHNCSFLPCLLLYHRWCRVVL